MASKEALIGQVTHEGRRLVDQLERGRTPKRDSFFLPFGARLPFKESDGVLALQGERDDYRPGPCKRLALPARY